MDLTGLTGLTSDPRLNGLSGVVSPEGDNASQFHSIFQQMLASSADSPSGLFGGFTSPYLMGLAAQNSQVQHGEQGPSSITGILKDFIGEEIKAEDGTFLGTATEIVMADDGYYVNVAGPNNETSRVKVDFVADGEADTDKALIGQEMAQAIRLQQTQFINNLVNRSETDDALDGSSSVDLSGYLDIASLKANQLENAETDFSYILNGNPTEGTLGKVHNGVAYLADGTPLKVSFSPTAS